MDSTVQALTLLSQWISFLFQAVPGKIAPTLLELLMGCMVCRDGHISSAVLAVRPQLSWTAYYKAIEKGRFEWLALSRQWMRLILNRIPNRSIEFALDDFPLPRSSKKAPSAAWHYDHAHRPNRPKFLWGQLRVSLAVICRHQGRVAAFPLLFRLIRKKGNRTKLDAAWLLMSVLMTWLPDGFLLILLLDAWYMKGPLVLPLIHKGVTVIGQVRKDTALFLPPANPPLKKRGRPRKYGPKLTLENIDRFCRPVDKILFAYGSDRLFHFYQIKAKVRFLDGRLCKIVWCRFMTDSASWSDWHLLIGTDPAMDGDEVITRYARRWWTEPMFNEIKHLFGLKNAWQQTRQALARWSMILCLAYSLPRLLALCLGPKAAYAMFPIPWRKNKPATAGWMARALSRLFGNVNVRAMWDRKSKKFQPQMTDCPVKSRPAA